MRTHNVLQTKHQLRHNFDIHVNFYINMKCMGPLNDGKKLKIDEKNKTDKIEKS